MNAEIARDRRIHDTPPAYLEIDKLLQPDRFKPDMFLFEDEETGELIHPQTPEIARMYLEKERQRMDEQFANRPPFDPAETIDCFAECYRKMLRYGGARFPEWVGETVDKRLLALNRIPEGAYERLKQEERANRRAFEKIEAEAAAVLSNQDIPDEIQSQFCFHDANVLALKKVRSDVALYLRKDCYWPGELTPYIKVVFQKVTKLDREKGFALRPKRNEHGELCSSCHYLYDELYRDEDGYEVHMLLCTPKDLRYLTIRCEDICFEDIVL